MFVHCQFKLYLVCCGAILFKKQSNLINTIYYKLIDCESLGMMSYLFQMSGNKGISAFPDGDNLFRWIATIQGAETTVSIVILLSGAQHVCIVFVHYAL